MQTLAKENNRPIGGNSPNPVTLIKVALTLPLKMASYQFLKINFFKFSSDLIFPGCCVESACNGFSKFFRALFPRKYFHTRIFFREI
jgi:hypothetical protein